MVGICHTWDAQGVEAALEQSPTWVESWGLTGSLVFVPLQPKLPFLMAKMNTEQRWRREFLSCHSCSDAQSNGSGTLGGSFPCSKLQFPNSQSGGIILAFGSAL